MHTFTVKYVKNLQLEACLGFGISLIILFYAFSPFRFGGGFIFQNQTELLTGIIALSLIGCIGILLKQIFTSNSRITFTQLDLLLSAYFVFLLLQLLFYSVNKDYILKIFCLASLYFLFRQISLRLSTGLLYLLPVFAVIQIVYGYIHLTEPWQGISEITGAFGNTGIFGGFIAMGFVATLGMMLSTKHPVIRIALGILLMPLAVQLLYSQSRASWISAAAGSVLLLFTLMRRWRNLFRFIRIKSSMTEGIRGWVIMFPIILLAGVLLSYKLYHFKKDSADGRLLIWTVSCHMLVEKTVTGFGPDGFQKNYPIRQGEYFRNHTNSPWSDLAGDISSPFNEWLKTGIEQGITGLLFIGGILFMAFRNMASIPVHQAILATLIAFACFSYPFEFVTFQVLAIFYLASIATTQQPIVIAGLTRNPLKYIVTVLIITSTGLVLFSSCKYYMDVKKWKNNV